GERGLIGGVRVDAEIVGHEWHGLLGRAVPGDGVSYRDSFEEIRRLAGGGIGKHPRLTLARRTEGRDPDGGLASVIPRVGNVLAFERERTFIRGPGVGGLVGLPESGLAGNRPGSWGRRFLRRGLALGASLGSIRTGSQEDSERENGQNFETSAKHSAPLPVTAYSAGGILYRRN